MEREHGSLVTAVMQRAAKQQGPPEPIFTTLRSGLETLITRMAACLPAGSVHLGCDVTGIQQHPGNRWALSVSRTETPDRFDAIILATPAHVTRQLLATLDPEAAALLEMEATSAIVVALAYEPDAAARLRIPRGFGFLVPPGEARSEEPRLLAGTFMHRKFAHRAPQGSVFLRGFFGGYAAPRMMDWPDAQIAEAACAQFSRVLGPLPAPTHTIVRRWPRSLPQYAVAHLDRMSTLARRIDQIPGLALVGNAYHGVGLPNLIEHGRATARQLARSLAGTGQTCSA
jgi:oxygen-dependent protoporphyrinogen oxidase